MKKYYLLIGSIGLIVGLSLWFGGVGADRKHTDLRGLEGGTPVHHITEQKQKAANWKECEK